MGQDRQGREIIIDTIHHKVHDGEMYTLNGRVTLTANLIQDMYIITGAKEVHLEGLIITEDDVYIDFVENPTYTTTSFTVSTLTAYNFNRSSSNGPVTQFWSVNTATATGGAALRKTMVIAGGIGNAGFGGSARQNVEWELAENTSYLLRITETTGATKMMSYELEFYEE